MQRTLVLGLDSIPQGFMFEKFLPWMPTIRRLMKESRYGTLRSTDPPITVPAWAVMFTGVDPGTLGIYGFRHRRLGSYTDMYTPTSKMIPFPPIWDLLSREGRRVAVIGMPPGYPPPAVNGVYISDFLTPDNAQDFVYPPALRAEVESIAQGEYMFDVLFRADDRDRVEREVFEMTRRRFAVARQLWAKEPWDFFAVHEIGPDRIHHAFWKFFDPTHPKYVTGSPFNSTAERYYRLLDEEIARFLELVPKEVTVWIASDHGSQSMQGCFCINEWLLKNGYLTLKGPRPKPGTPLDNVPIDWSRTRVWGAGGYYARLFFNVRGREPEGIVSPQDVPELARELQTRLNQVTGPDGQPFRTSLLDPHQIYRGVRGDPPDLMAYFQDLHWRSAGTIGYDGLFLAENDTGPDDSVHSMDGFFLLYAPNDHATPRRLADQSILDVAPTLMQRMGVPIPPHVQGKVIPELLSG